MTEHDTLHVDLGDRIQPALELPAEVQAHDERHPATIDAWVSREEAIALTGLSERSLYRKVAEECWRTRPSGRTGSNGRPIPEIAVSSLPGGAQAKYWATHLVPAEAPATDPLNLAAIPECLRTEAKRRLGILEAAAAIFAGPRGLREAALKAFCEPRELSPSTVYRWHQAYAARGIGALLPKWGKRRGRFFGISDEVHDFLKQEHCSPRRPDRTTLYRFLRTFCAAIHQPCPSIATVNRFLNTLPPPAVILAREGEQAWRAQCEPKCERDLSTLGVGAWWVSDHREFDVFVQLPWWDHVAKEMQVKIFRPWLTAWLDLRSRALVGYVVTMGPSSETIACALRDGIQQYGLPAHLYRDRGKDYKSNWWGGKYVTHRHVRLSDDAMLLVKPGVISAAGIQLHAAKAYTPWAKPIESWFGHTFPQWERRLPGWCGSDNTERPEKLAKEIANRELLTLDAFTARVAECIAGYNGTPHSALDGAAPNDLWRGQALERPHPRTLDLLLMKHKPVTVTTQGIKLFGRCYQADELALRVNTKVSVRYSPAEIGRLVVMDPATHAFVCEAVNQPALQMGASEADVKALAASKKRARQAAGSFLDHRRVLMNPEQALADLTAQRRAQTVVALPPRDPAPAAGTLPVTRLVPALDRAAAQTTHASVPASAEENGPPPSGPRGRRPAAPAPRLTTGRAAQAGAAPSREDLLNELMSEAR